jgi:alpha-galactosidase
MNRVPTRALLFTACAIVSTSLLARGESVQLSSLGPQNIHPVMPAPSIDKSVGGNAITLGGQKYDHGVSVQSPSRIVVNLNGAATRFTAVAGLDDEVKSLGTGGNVQMSITGDGRRLWPPAPAPTTTQARGPRAGGRGVPALTRTDAPQNIDLDLSGIKTLVLEVAQSNDGAINDHADWADATFVYTGAKPSVLPTDQPIILTPKTPATPRINGARVFGVRPGHPFMFTVPATGDRPMQFSAEGLPSGLKLDPATGFITGVTNTRGEYDVTLHARNARGEASGPLKIVVGDMISLTPAMGWNSWNCFANAVDAGKVKAAADAMVSSGLINHGWTYINIDDYWEINENRGRTDPTLAGEPRKPDGTINTNSRFPDMKGLTDYIHSLGLKAGLYSSPGPTTCGGCIASYQHEEQDAMTWAGWGFDYIKYDWCSYGNIVRGQPQTLEYHMKPYQVMQQALAKVDRDILYSLCQYGNGNVWEWGAQVNGNSWRTTSDITDTWDSLSRIGFSQAGHEQYAGPGHWNDPDMLIVGHVGWGPALHPTNLTPSEQYTHITLWSLLCSPLLIGCDMTKFDDFTLNLLTNDEVIAVNQDPLGKQAGRVLQQDGFEVWAKEMSDGSKAVGIFNRNELPRKFTAKWSDLGISGRRIIRDLWRQQNVGESDSQYETEIPRHGAVLIQLRPAR